MTTYEKLNRATDLMVRVRRSFLSGRISRRTFRALILKVKSLWRALLAAFQADAGRDAEHAQAVSIREAREAAEAAEAARLAELAEQMRRDAEEVRTLGEMAAPVEEKMHNKRAARERMERIRALYGLGQAAQQVAHV